MELILATGADLTRLDAVYAGRKPYYGDLHDHAATGGRSDGHCTLDEWKTGMAELKMDFATIVDHKQVRHMYLDQWDPTMFIGGTEAATWIEDYTHVPVNADGKLQNSIHYNMIFAEPEPLLDLLKKNEEFHFEGTALDGFFPRYPRYEKTGLQKLVEDIKAHGGFFSHVHPKSKGVLNSEDPLDYWFGDETGLEVVYTYREDRDGEDTANNYKLWTDLLALGKRVWATTGNDRHRYPSDKALSTIYAGRKHAVDFVDRLRVGDFVAGPVAIRMCVGDTPMGGKTEFAGKRLVFSLDAYHPYVFNPEHNFRVELLSDAGVVAGADVKCTEQFAFALDAGDVNFYRIEVFDTTLNSRIAIGNPIWNG